MIQICNGAESLSETAARLFVQHARRAVQTHGRFTVALSGGHTPERTYQLLAQPPLRDRVPWGNVHAFWGDERCVPPDDPRSNARMAHQTLLDHVPIPPDQVHPIRCDQNPQQGAEAYEALLRGVFADRQPGFDLVLLGLGENGHTASIFPDTPAVEEHERWAVAVYVDEQTMWRVTLTAPLINQAATVAFLVAGVAKAQVLHRVLDGPFEPHTLPAQLIRPVSGNLHWMIDKQASQQLIEAKTHSNARTTEEVFDERPQM
jgi:6-phosphogluconolactonase